MIHHVQIVCTTEKCRNLTFRTFRHVVLPFLAHKQVPSCFKEHGPNWHIELLMYEFPLLDIFSSRLSFKHNVKSCCETKSNFLFFPILTVLAKIENSKCVISSALVFLHVCLLCAPRQADPHGRKGISAPNRQCGQPAI